MPQGSVFEEYSDPGKACLEVMTEKRHNCMLGLHENWYHAVLGGDERSEASTHEQHKIKMKSIIFEESSAVHGVALHARERWQINYPGRCKKLQETTQITH